MTDDVWREFFDSFAPQYMNEVFTTDSVREVAFLTELLELPEGAAILDIGCGTGRHAVELARAGYAVTGIDLSSGMLREAGAAAERAGVELELVQADATSFDLGREFDAAVCLCEGSFGLLGSDDAFEHDAAVLRRAFAALRPGAPFVLTLLNGMRMIRDATPEQVERGAFDPATLTEILRDGVAGGGRSAHPAVPRARLRAERGRAALSRCGLRRRARLGRHGGQLGSPARGARRDGDHGRAAEAAGVSTAAAVGIRKATPDDAEGVAAVLNGAILGGSPTLLDTPFSVDGRARLHRGAAGARLHPRRRDCRRTASSASRRWSRGASS